ncbi:transcriptional regulator [bacterium]|nr:transcriptional regulator [bacterium]
MTSPMPRTIRPLIASAAALFSVACVSPVAGPSGLYAQPIGGAPVVANPTPYSAGLVCLGEAVKRSGAPGPRIAVGRVLDYTGKEDFEGGRKVTQGASLMAISAFAKAGAQLVERFDTSVSELELRYANNRLIGDDAAAAAQGDFRKIVAGSIPGSDYYLVGGITELNSNIRSLGADAFIGDLDAEDPKGRAGAKLFVINVGIDLRLVRTQTLEVVDVISYQKQIIGRELSAGIFDFANNNVFDVGAGERAIEPIQLAVRSVIERAVLEMTSNLYGVASSDVCSDLTVDRASTLSVVGNFERPAAVQAAIAAATPDAPVPVASGLVRAHPSPWHAKRDPDVKATLRGRTSAN